ncbi:MAG: caspase family protein [Agriterribacter sp.]
MKQKGYSLHIGLNAVDPKKYDNWDGQLFGCENDATIYKTIATQAKFENITTLLTQKATSHNVLAELKKAATDLKEGDMLLISYSGHGGTVADENGDEDDLQDETWCLYDRQLIDDELFEAFKDFKTGVRILMFSDSCHSGTVSRFVPGSNKALTEQMRAEQEIENTYIRLGYRSRLVPKEIQPKINAAQEKVLQPIKERPPVFKKDINAAVMLFAACQDNESARELGENGVFSATLKKIIKAGLFDEVSDYKSLYKKILSVIPKVQKPNLFVYGKSQGAFNACLPFSIDGKAKVKISFSSSTTGKKKAKKMPAAETLLIDTGKKSATSRSKGKSRSAEIETLQIQRAAIKTSEHPWDKAYEIYFNRKKSKEPVVFVEPDIKSVFIREPEIKISRDSTNNYLANWPKPQASPNEFIWHLDDEHSQLRKASDEVQQKLKRDKRSGETIRIGHVDTGYLPGHPSIPRNLLKDMGVSFWKDEFGINKGIDKLDTGTIAEQDGHGTATLALLAGNTIAAADAYAGYSGDVGAIPFAEVIPIRICDTVFNAFNANDVARGIEYAVEYGCEVVTMSMAGYPTREVAKAVNMAYEKGVVVVTAAGNNFVKGLGKLSPKAVLYPARFDRVIAATGACYDHMPYDVDAPRDIMKARSEGGEFMQGSWGPESAMNKAIAAYTPNVPWASYDKPYTFSKAGGGTSSATPQVAATAALWLLYHRDELSGFTGKNAWKKVEAVRKAMYATANKAYPYYKKYYGNGIIRAFDALNYIDLNDLAPSREARVLFFGIIPFIGTWIRSKEKGRAAVSAQQDSTLNEMISLELMQVVYQDESLMDYAEVIEFEDADGGAFLQDKAAREKFFNKIKASPYASEFLKSVLVADAPEKRIRAKPKPKSKTKSAIKKKKR